MARRTVRAAPSQVATDAIPADRSATMSCTAPKAWEAMPHRKKADSDAHAVVSNVPPASTRPKTAGLAKWVLDVMESSSGRSLNRRPGTEYARTAKTLTASTAVEAGVPAQTRKARNGRVGTPAEQLPRRGQQQGGGERPREVLDRGQPEARSGKCAVAVPEEVRGDHDAVE